MANNNGLQVYSSLMAPGKQQGLLSIYMVYNSLQQSLHGWQQFTTVLTNKAVWDFM